MENRKVALRPRRFYSMEQRRKAVELHKEGFGYKRISRALGIERSIIREWLRRYQKYGENGLRPWWRKNV